MAKTLYDLLRPIQQRTRGRRMRRFAEQFGLTSSTRVLDVGGTHDNWLLAPVRPQVTLLNNERTPLDRSTVPPEFTYLVGDGCQLPFPDSSFDVVYSNSVIEHLGCWEQQVRFAHEVRRVGRSFYVQTPNRRFPVEPHVVGLAVHWIPRERRAPYLRYLSLHGLIHRRPLSEYQAFVDEVAMLSEEDMRALFPDAAIEAESFAGLEKSLIAVGAP